MTTHDYEPLDLSTLYNATIAAYNRPARPPATGEQYFHGLPFHIGPHDKACFLGFNTGNTTQSVTVPVGKTARRILFAHALLGSRLHEGAHPGGVVAEYSVVAGSHRTVVPIRERFEIGVVPVAWGQLAFLAVPDNKNSLMNRYHGQWGAAGFRQSEARGAYPGDYYLWAWQNPHPETTVDTIEITAVTDLPFVVAAITLGHLEEEPFVRNAAVSVRLVLPEVNDAEADFDLEVEVDRGTASFPFALPEQTPDEFLNDPFRGWGEKQNASNNPAYTTIAATPSATVSVRRDGEEIGSTRWGELEAKGTVQAGRVHFEIVDSGRNWVHTTVVDDATGKPIPCRVHFRSPHGIPYAPHGHHAYVNSNLDTWHIDVGGDLRLGQISYAYIDGKCQGWLPRGEVIVDVARGFEYEPLRARVEIRPGQRELTLRLKRHHDLKRERYFSGDTHVHFLSSHGALLEARGEDLDVVNLLLSQWGHLFTNTEDFTGEPLLSGDGETIVYASQENRQHLLGHLSLLGLKEPVMPWCTDGPGEAELGGNLETTMSQWADACHAQGGTVVIPHLPVPNAEPAALIATGRADAVEMLRHDPYFHLEYYRYLNGGYRLPLAGGTDKMDSGVPIGLYRTYAHIPADEPFTYENWCRALRGGNTFLSGGPLLHFTVDGKPIGSTLVLPKGGGSVEVEARATSIFPIHTLEIVQQGHVVAATEEKHGARSLHLKTSLQIDGSAWLCARCGGPEYSAVPHHDTKARGLFAHTSPIYIACGDYDVFSADTMHYMLTLLDGTLQYIRQRAPQWRRGTTTHHHSHHDHQEFLEQPFQEAAAAIHRKMHEHGIPH